MNRSRRELLWCTRDLTGEAGAACLHSYHKREVNHLWPVHDIAIPHTDKTARACN